MSYHHTEKNVFFSLSCSSSHVVWSIKVSHEPCSNAPTCFSILSPTKPDTDLKPVNRLVLRSLCVCVISGRHLLSTQISSSRSRVQRYSRETVPLAAPETALSADSGLILGACVFTIMILSCFHTHTSPKCFPHCAWKCFHLCFICFLFFFYSLSLFLCSAVG